MAVRKLRIAAELLLHLGSGQFRVEAHQLPADVRLVGVEVENELSTVVLCVESAEFKGDEGESEDLTPPIISQI